MANTLTTEDIEKIRQVAFLLYTKINWSRDGGGGSAKNAYDAVINFLDGPAVMPHKYCQVCGAELKK